MVRQLHLVGAIKQWRKVAHKKVECGG